MSARSDAFLLWSARILGLVVCLFFSLFALDAFGGGRTFFQALPGYLIHVAPVLALLGVVLLSWRWEWVGALVFTVLAAVYAYAARLHPSWILAISGPLLLVGVLFFASWRRHHARQGTTPAIPAAGPPR